MINKTIFVETARVTSFASLTLNR